MVQDSHKSTQELSHYVTRLLELVENSKREVRIPDEWREDWRRLTEPC